jgi:hypothetical protein
LSRVLKGVESLGNTGADRTTLMTMEPRQPNWFEKKKNI